MNSTPTLSVLITCGDRRERVANALASVLNQTDSDQFEIILLECGNPDNSPVPGCDRPNVRRHQFPQGVGGGHVRATGIRMAGAPIVAFLEEHAAYSSDWSKSVFKVFEDPNIGVVSPEVVNANPTRGISSSMSLVYYALFESPSLARTANWIPIHNCAFKRKYLLAHDDILEDLISHEILLQWQLRRDGYQIICDRTIKFWHLNETDIPTVWRGNINASRMFIAKWAKLDSWGKVRKLWRILYSPLAPLIRTARLLQTITKHCPWKLRRFWKGIPVILVANIATAIGEFLGLSLGIGQADQIYMDHGVNAVRETPAEFPFFRL